MGPGMACHTIEGCYTGMILQSMVLCRGNFFISKSWEGSFRCLELFWAPSQFYRAKRADYHFPVSAAEGPPSVNKVLSGTPLPDSRSGFILRPVSMNVTLS